MKPFILTALALLLAFAALAATSGSDSRSGVWTADIRDTKVQMTVFTGSRQSRNGHSFSSNNMGFSLPLSRFEGLTGADGDAKFAIRAAAGVMAFDGHFSDAKGAGHFTFTPSEAFVREMAAMGYTEFRDDEVLMFATTDFQPAQVRALKSMGYEIRQRDLDEIAVFHITPEIIHDYERAGYSNLPLRTIVDLRVGNVDDAYISAIKGLGYTDVAARDLAEMAILGVTPKYIEALSAMGYDHIPAKRLVEMRALGVDAAYIKEMTAIGVTDLKKMIELRATGAGEILLKKKSR